MNQATDTKQTQLLTLEQLNAKVNDMCSKFEEVMTFGQPIRQIQEWSINFDRLEQNFQKLFLEFSHIKETRLVELISDADIKKLYAQSNSSIAEIQSDFNVSQTQAHRLANGEVKDIALRNKIKQYFLKKIRENK